jgi:low temperature requirement protein LtrA
MIVSGHGQNGRPTSARFEDLRTAYKCIWIFAVCNAIALATVITTAALGGTPSVFMWVRAIILVAASPVLLWMARRSGQGSGSIMRRLTLVGTVLPIAVIVIDFIPGVAPMWYGVMQGLGALLLIPVAVIGRRWSRA